MAKNNSEANIEGFFDGYKARNLATNKITFDFHVDEMIRLIDQLKENSHLHQNEKSTLDKGETYLKSNLIEINPKNYYDNILNAGQSLKTFLDFNTFYDAEVVQPFKKIIYHYLNLASELEEDKRIENLAREVAEKFSSLNQ
jgi:hypothetical protein